MTHAHLTSGVLALILFCVAVILHKSGKKRGAKIVQMILRVTYVLILLTGLMLFFGLTKISGMYILKFVAGLWVIAAFEMVLGKLAKDESATGPWIQFLIAVVLALYLGFALPLGIYIF